MPASRLRSVEFRRERQSSWRELDGLVSRAERKGLGALKPRELMRLPVLYRAALSSLSVARSISLDRNVVDYLEALASRAYCCVYGSRGGIQESLVRFFRVRFPATVRKLRRELLLAALLLLSGVLTGFVMTSLDQERFYTFVSDAYASGRTPASSTDVLRAGLYDDGGDLRSRLVVFASFLFTNNAQVGFTCFAVGFAAGLPVILILFINGLLLGAFGALYHERGLSADLWGWIFPHGVTEILAVILCAGAGLSVGRALLFPGRHHRLENLGKAGREAALLVIGATCLFLIAGLIEGIFRQTVMNIVIRYAVALTTLGFWIYYFGFVGRGGERGKTS